MYNNIKKTNKKFVDFNFQIVNAVSTKYSTCIRTDCHKCSYTEVY